MGGLGRRRMGNGGEGTRGWGMGADGGASGREDAEAVGGGELERGGEMGEGRIRAGKRI